MDFFEPLTTVEVARGDLSASDTSSAMCDALNYFGEHLAGPILAAVVGGPLAALTFRYFGTGKVVADNDAEATAIRNDLRRWVKDRDRQLTIEIRGIKNTAATRAKTVGAVVESELSGTPGSQLYTGSLENQVVGAMHRALHEYRDEASGKVRRYSAIARSEGWMERFHRSRNSRDPTDLTLDRRERKMIEGWRSREHPVEKEKAITVFSDPTKDEGEIAPLEAEAGLTWSAAASAATL